MENNQELCVRCGKTTEYEINTPTVVRPYYVEGAGQLCAECWKKVYRMCILEEDEYEENDLE